MRGLDQEACDRDRQAADPDLPGGRGDRRQIDRQLLRQHRAERETERACQRHQDARQLGLARREGGAGMPAQILSVQAGSCVCDARPVDSGGGL